MSAGRYVGTALGGVLKSELTAAQVDEWWNETDPALRERDENGVITLWPRAISYPGRLPFPFHLHPIDGGHAA